MIKVDKSHNTPAATNCTRRKVGWVLSAAAAAMLAATPAIATERDRDDDDRERTFSIGEDLRLLVFGLTADQRLVRFRAATPQLARPIGPISGLAKTDTALVGIDFRVQDGKLYGLGNGGGIYTIDTGTAQATQVSQLTVALDGTSFGVDFNPAANALRIVSDTGQNLRHPFAGATAGQTQTDMPLNYMAGMTATGITGAAYTNNDLDPNTGTTLFDLDPSRNQVAIQSPPNNGSLVPTGSLTIDPDAPVGFDIYTQLKNGAASNNGGFASLVVNAMTGFYRVNVLTGKASLIGNFKEAVIDIAIPLDQ
jgi:Domain of unknown function (DUF4394)